MAEVAARAAIFFSTLLDFFSAEAASCLNIQ
jgi:hypothetical protein